MTAPFFSLPSKPKNNGAATSGSQRDRRFTDTFYDTYRHPRFPQGRPFTGQREFQSGSETESIAAGFLQSDLQCGAYYCDNPEQGQTPEERSMSLASAWVAPWLPPGGKKYMNFNYRRKIITFKYETFIADESTALALYWQAAAKMAGDNDVIDPERPAAVPFRIKVSMGSPFVYLDKIKLARAAIAGDPWLMGAVEDPNEELAKILGLGKVQYAGEGYRADKDYVLIPSAPASQPPLTPQQVVSAAPDQLAKMIAEAVAAAMAVRDAQVAAKKEADRAKMAKARGARKPAGASA